MEAVSLDVGMEVAGATAEEGVGPARRGDKGDTPGARRQDAGESAAQVKAAPRRRPWWVKVVLLRYLREIVDAPSAQWSRSEEHTSELQSLRHLVCRILLENKNNQ